MTTDVTMVACTSYNESVSEAFTQAGGPKAISGFEQILLKPNLVNSSPFPITTHPDFVRAVIDAIRAHTDAQIVIAEGCGAASMDTDEIFTALGYDQLAHDKDVSLLDLNHAPLVKKSNPDCTVWPEMWLPEVAFTHCIVSLPVLKAHSLADMTGTLKNMMGFPPPKHYQGGGWKKASFHARMHGSIKDLNAYITPHFTVMDATVGLSQYHLGGPECVPPIGKLMAGADPLSIDRAGAELLGLDWQQIGHLR